jgi:hypothetical protein
MTNAAQINNDDSLCHGPEDGASDQPLVGDGCSAFPGCKRANFLNGTTTEPSAVAPDPGVNFGW